MISLRQRYFLSTKTFQLEENKILIKEKSVFDEREWEARYNEVGLDLVKIKSREGIGNAVLFGGLLMVSTHMTYNAFTDGADIKLAFLFLFFCFMWATVFWWSIQKYFAAHFILNGGAKTLTFFINSPDEQTVRTFIDLIRARAKDKLIDELTTFDPDMSFDQQLANLKYLKKIEVLEQTDFEGIREELKERHLLK
ncbi:MAG: hypothetical protein ACFB15_18700 [Cyclobacteriaceae bacterium]